jgi:general secretion pathway protein G
MTNQKTKIYRNILIRTLVKNRNILNDKTFRGYTLIELLVVIAIIGILMGFMTVAYDGTRQSARDGRRKADLEMIRSALELCHSDTGSYPVTTTLPANITCNSNNYMKVPSDPISASYTYTYNGTANSYTLCSYLEGSTETSACTGSCTGNCGAACKYKVCNP